MDLLGQEMHERMVRACAQARTCESNRSADRSLLKGAEVKRGVNPGGRLFRVLVHLVFFDFAGVSVFLPQPRSFLSASGRLTPRVSKRSFDDSFLKRRHGLAQHTLFTGR